MSEDTQNKICAYADYYLTGIFVVASFIYFFLLLFIYSFIRFLVYFAGHYIVFAQKSEH